MKTLLLQIALFAIGLLALPVVVFCSPGKVVVATPSAQDWVAVHLVDSQEKPVPGEAVNLLICRRYTSGVIFDTHIIVVETPVGNCVTDQNGRCQIAVSADTPKDMSDYLRGALYFGKSGKRWVSWPGGLLDVKTRLDQLRSNTEPPGNEDCETFMGGVE